VVAALKGGEYDTGLDLEKMWDIQSDVEVLKRNHIDDLSPFADRVDASILRYHMPGLMLEDVHRQLAERNASGRLAEVLEEANRVRLELGYPPLVAPIRQMIANPGRLQRYRRRPLCDSHPGAEGLPARFVRQAPGAGRSGAAQARPRP